MIDADQLQHLLKAVANGSLSAEDAANKIQFAPLEGVGFDVVGDFAKVDRQRHMRNGIPEAVWGPGKTPEQIAQILQNLYDNGGVAMATRITPEVYEKLQKSLPELQYSEMARIAFLERQDSSGDSPEIDGLSGTIGVITAGTSDLPVAEEAALTAELCGATVQRLSDVGVAGIHRLLHNREIFTSADVLIVVAGMEGALASVVAGLADRPIIAVPTSIGYGASFGGVSALLTMLNSCAAGVGVMNIDNGFGASMMALQILRTARRISTQSPPND